jgi:hypothetical protein
MRSPSPNAADPISDLSVGRDAFHPSLPSHSSQVTLPDNHLDTLTGDVIPAVVIALPLGLLELVDVLSQDRHGCRPLLVGRRGPPLRPDWLAIAPPSTDFPQARPQSARARIMARLAVVMPSTSSRSS